MAEGRTDLPEISKDAAAVRKALMDAGLETPMIPVDMNTEQKYQRIKTAMTEVLTTLGLNLEDDSLHRSPHRIAKMYVEEIFTGLDYANFPKITVIENKMQVEEMVKISKISVNSTCEHHFVTIDGRAKVAYIPKRKVVGLSKVNRIVRFFSQRPQVQERLTKQVLVALQTLLETEDVAVTIDATHYCVKSRGVMDFNSETQTTSLGGCFKENHKTRAEFLA